MSPGTFWHILRLGKEEELGQETAGAASERGEPGSGCSSGVGSGRRGHMRPLCVPWVGQPGGNGATGGRAKSDGLWREESERSSAAP